MLVLDAVKGHHNARRRNSVPLVSNLTRHNPFSLSTLLVINTMFKMIGKKLEIMVDLHTPDMRVIVRLLVLTVCVDC